MKLIITFLLVFLFLNPVNGLAQTANIAQVSSAGNEQGSGLLAEYYNGANFETKVLSRIDKEINFYYNRESPAPGVRREYYSIRWTGSLYAPITGTYKLSVRVDDGIRFWLNNKIILDRWQLQEAASFIGEVKLTAGEFYTLKIEYFNGPIHGIMRLLWEMPKEEEETNSLFDFFSSEKGLEPIPGKYLYTAAPVKSDAVVQIAPKTEKAEPTENPVASKSKLVPQAATPAPVVAPRKSKENPGHAESVVVATKSANTPAAESKISLDESIYENLRSGDEVKFNKVLFEQGKFILLEPSYTELNKLVRTLKQQPDLQIRLEGHTDNVGNPKHNLSLSFFRAKVVATYLIEQGIEDYRLEVKGYGSSRPLTSNSTEAGRSRNRRVQFVVK